MKLFTKSLSMKRINIFFIAILLAATPFVSIAANANDQEIKGLLQTISSLVSEIDGTLASLRQSGTYTGIVAGATSASASEIIIDNTSSQTKKAGTWCTSAASNFYGTDSVYSCGSGADIFSWIPSLQESAKYEVFMWWTQHQNRSAQGLVQIVEEKGTVTQKLVNQQINGGKWNSLGVYSFGPATGATAGSGGFVKISDQYGQVAADAVKFVKVESAPVALKYSKLSVPTNTLSNGTNIIYRFAANSSIGDAILNNPAFNVKVLGADAFDPVMYVYADSAFSLFAHSGPIPGVFKDNGLVEFNSPDPINIPGGSTRYFEVRFGIKNKTAGAIVSSYPVFTALPTETLSAGGTITPSIAVLSPNGGEVWAMGENQTVKWSGSNGTRVNITLLNTDKTKEVYGLAMTVINDGSEMIKVPYDLAAGQYYLRVSCVENCSPEVSFDDSNAPFSIAVPTSPPVAQPAITSISPQQGQIGVWATIYGSGFTPAGNSIAFWSAASNGSESRIFSNLSSDGRSLAFTVPATLTRISEAGNSEIPVTAQLYKIVVQNANGKSNIVDFWVVNQLPPPPSTADIIIDNGATGTSKTGSWCVSGASGFYGTNSLYSCGLNTFETYRWSPSLPGTAYDAYEVSMWWTQHANRSTNVPVKILANIGGVQIPNTIYVNQQANGGKWNSLGTFLLGAGSYVEVSDKNGQANADAVKFVKVVSSTPLPVPTVSFSASPSLITSVQSSTLTWTSTSATSCTASGAWSGTKTISGIQVVNPTITSTYTLICTGGGGSATNSVTITVSTAPSASLSAADITSNFEMGSGFNFVDIAPNTIQIDAELENGKTYTHTPYFKIQQDALNNSPIFKIRFGWGGYHSYLYNPAGTPDTPNASWVYSYDNINWVRFPAGSTHYDLASDAVTMQSPVFTQNTVYISPLIPYGYTTDYMSDKARWVANPNVTFSTLGTSVEGRSIELFTITNVSSLIPEASKKVYFIIRSGHPIEQHTSWRLRGMIDWVLSNDPEAIRFRDKAILKATFNANVDGWVAGSFRTNAHGQDMNRDYEYTGANPALEEPETYAIHRAIEKYMATNHIDVFMDMHDSSSPSGGEQLYRAYSMPNSTSLTQLMTTINGLDTSNLINNGINSYHYPITTYTDGVYGQYASRGVKSFMTEGGASFHQNGSYVTKASSEEVGRILIKAFFKWLVP